jgi:hypothetical protein
MEQNNLNQTKLLETILEHLDIPKSLYEKARDRHRSLAEWLKRDSSTIRRFEPDIRPQGSFRYGTVNRPLDPDDEYDLDNVCVLTTLGKSTLTQQQLKHLYGNEIKAYAREHGMIAPVEEHNRCWRLCYADEVSFHLDTLPCVPEEAAIILRLTAAGVPDDLARRAVAITDRRHPQYEQITALWPSSNPRGFAAFFEQQAALGRAAMLREGKILATIEDVPPYEWKTPLQRSIQILKRHRDVMFKATPELAPISMIITNLSARAYKGETNLAVALANIVEKMPDFVGRQRPWVPNPADPFEDYADKWAIDHRLEKSFWEWHTAVKSDIARLSSTLGTSKLPTLTETAFDVSLTADEARNFGGSTSGNPAIARAAPAIVIPSAPRPWGR